MPDEFFSSGIFTLCKYCIIIRHSAGGVGQKAKNRSMLKALTLLPYSH